MSTRFNLSALALKYSTLTVFFMIALVAAGIFAFFNLGRGEDPPFTIKQMVVSAAWPGATAREVEQQVTEKIEKKLQELPYFDNVQSYTKPGETVIYVSLRDDTPPARVPDLWYQVRKKVGDIRGTLPQGVLGPFFNDEYGDTYGLIWAFEADGFAPAEAQGDRQVGAPAAAARARRHQGRPARAAGREDLHRVQPHAAGHAGRCRSTRSSRSCASRTPSWRPARSRPRASASRCASTARRSRPRSWPPCPSPPTAARSPWPTWPRSSAATRTRRRISMRYKGKPVIGLGVVMAPGGNVQTLGKALEQTMAEVEADLPVGITVHRVANQPEVVEKSFEEFISSLFEALAIVLVVSFISLGMRSGLIVALSVPLVLAITFVGMMLLGIDFQRISLGALIIALGLLVDDAIIAVEMMMVKLEQGCQPAARPRPTPTPRPPSRC